MEGFMITGTDFKGMLSVVGFSKADGAATHATRTATGMPEAELGKFIKMLHAEQSCINFSVDENGVVVWDKGSKNRFKSTGYLFIVIGKVSKREFELYNVRTQAYGIVDKAKILEMQKKQSDAMLFNGIISNGAIRAYDGYTFPDFSQENRRLWNRANRQAAVSQGYDVKKIISGAERPIDANISAKDNVALAGRCAHTLDGFIKRNSADKARKGTENAVEWFMKQERAKAESALAEFTKYDTIRGILKDSDNTPDMDKVVGAGFEHMLTDAQKRAQRKPAPASSKTPTQPTQAPKARGIDGEAILQGRQPMGSPDMGEAMRGNAVSACIGAFEKHPYSKRSSKGEASPDSLVPVANMVRWYIGSMNTDDAYRSILESKSRNGVVREALFSDEFSNVCPELDDFLARNFETIMGVSAATKDELLSQKSKVQRKAAEVFDQRNIPREYLEGMSDEDIAYWGGKLQSREVAEQCKPIFQNTTLSPEQRDALYQCTLYGVDFADINDSDLSPMTMQLERQKRYAIASGDYNKRRKPDGELLLLAAGAADRIWERKRSLGE